MDTRKLLEKNVEPESFRGAGERGCIQSLSFSPAFCYHSVPTKTSMVGFMSSSPHLSLLTRVHP